MGAWSLSSSRHRPTGKLARVPVAELHLTPWVMEVDGLMLGDQGLGSLGDAPALAGWDWDLVGGWSLPVWMTRQRKVR